MVCLGETFSHPFVLLCEVRSLLSIISALILTAERYKDR